MKLIDNGNLNPCKYNIVHNGKVVFSGSADNIRYSFGKAVEIAHTPEAKGYNDAKHSYIREHFNELSWEIIEKGGK